MRDIIERAEAAAKAVHRTGRRKMTDLQARISGVVLNRLADSNYGIDMIAREIADSVAEAVTAMPGIAIVELPDAMPKGQTRWPDDAAFPVGERAAVRVFRNSIRWRDSKYPVDYARALAAALLAAAVQAQEEQPGAPWCAACAEPHEFGGPDCVRKRHDIAAVQAQEEQQ